MQIDPGLPKDSGHRMTMTDVVERIAALVREIHALDLKKRELLVELRDLAVSIEPDLVLPSREYLDPSAFGEYQPKSLADRIRLLLRQEPQRAWNAREMAVALKIPKASLKVFYACLAKLRIRGEIERPARSMYRSVSQAPHSSSGR